MKRIFLFALVLMMGLAACTNQVSTSNKLKVVATTTQMADFAKNIGGDRIELQDIMKPNVDPHEYEPAPSDVVSLADARLILQNGVGLEKNLEKLIKTNATKATIFTAGDYVKLLPGSSEDPEGDPHIWFSVENVKKIITGLTDTLSKVDPANAGYYSLNRDAYLVQLSDLDLYIKDQINTVPPGNLKLVTNHDAFGYYVKDYGISFVGAVIPGLSTDSEPSAAEIAALIQKIKSEDVKAIFAESSIDPKLAKQIAREAGVKINTTLYGDTLGDSGSTGDTYLNMMRYNTDTIVQNLK
jgi:zinc/manganese transport system substrate-binding protein/manganese/iron transport system substrate-binding protein